MPHSILQKSRLYINPQNQNHSLKRDFMRDAQEVEQSSDDTPKR